MKGADMGKSVRAVPPGESRLSIDEFLAFTESRPDEERWELIEGLPVLSPSPTDYHQMIVANITHVLMLQQERTHAPWFVMPGTGTRVPLSKRSLPRPDVFVKEEPPSGSAVTNEAIVIFEILSRSNARKDQAWRRRVYASVPNCQHYVTVSLKSVLVTAFDRATNWHERRIVGLRASLELPAIGASLRLSQVYRATALAQSR
jgi:Uma2 family endonuclease